MVNVFILLGGLVGFDGYAVSPGILLLAHRLEAFGEVKTYNWTAQREVKQRVASLDPNEKVVLIGYSGGSAMEIGFDRIELLEPRIPVVGLRSIGNLPFKIVDAAGCFAKHGVRRDLLRDARQRQRPGATTAAATARATSAAATGIAVGGAVVIAAAGDEPGGSRQGGEDGEGDEPHPTSFV